MSSLRLEERRIETAALPNADLFATAFHHASVGTGLVTPEGRWLHVNRSLCELVGYSDAELLATTFHAITCTGDPPSDTDPFRDLLANKIAHYRAEKRYKHKQGYAGWVLLSLSLAKDEDGEPLFFILQMQDITARKAAEEQLNELIENLRTALADVNQLRGIVSICSYCRKVRDDNDYWHQLETYITKRSGAQFSHGICPGCVSNFE